MLKLDNVLQLKEDEEIRMVSKRHAVTILPNLFVAFLLIVVPFFFLFPLFGTGPTGVVAFLVLILAGLIIAWRTFAMWDGDALVISSLRIIKVNQTGIFSRTVSEMGAENVKEASWEKKGLFGHVFNYGNLNIAAVQTIKMRHVPRPQEVHALIQEVTDALKKHEAIKKSDHEERVNKLRSMIEDMDDEKLKEIERSIEKDDRTETVKELFAADDNEEGEEEDIPVKKLFGTDDESNNLKPLDDEV